ncbi:MAG: Type I Iterative PKS [Chrysothrix sp. TS-e1954]|nr:MAG: Type I Iterative PKS [Chrysothrix sp. TS-e1954]
MTVFGPRIKAPEVGYLDKLRDFVQSSHILHDLQGVVRSLPKLLSQISEDLEDVTPSTNASKRTEAFVDWFFGELPSSEIADNQFGDTVLPLLALIQIAQYLSFLHTKGLDHASLVSHLQYFGGIQGHCGGLPCAIAVACSANEDELGQNFAVALRVAFIIGVAGSIHDDGTTPAATMAIVRLKRPEQRDSLVQSFPDVFVSAVTDPKTITVSGSAHALTAMRDYAKELGLLVQDWPLRGKWHHPQNSRLAQSLIKWCEDDDLLQFPQTQAVKQLTRSNREGDFIKKGSYTEELITAILASRCEWHTVLQNVAADLKAQNQQQHVIASFGVGDCTPLSTFHHHRLHVSKIDGYACFAELNLPATQSSKTSSISISDDCVAIVGASCRLPGASDLETLWSVSEDGKDLHREIDGSRFKLADSFRASEATSDASSKPFFGNFLDDVGMFDNTFFRISAKESASMDPQQRILLELAYEAMDSCGYIRNHVREDGDPIACFIGASAVDYHENTASHSPTAYTSTGTISSFLSGKISHYFGWTGPSEVIDTACSSSLVAIARACKALQARDCDMALAGGVNIMTSGNPFLDLGRAGFLSPSGQCKPFDQAADGYCRSEGAGIVVLKLLGNAKQDGDNILAAIPGISTNQGGPSPSITVPYAPAQVSLYRKVLQQAKISAHDISYVEAHGTGTQVGDPIEMDSIREVFKDSSRIENLFIGSIKGNIGHCETAAGVAGLLKVITMLAKHRIPPQANYRSLNPKIKRLESSHLTISQRSRPWESKQRAAIVNSYGASGSNAALVVCEYAGPVSNQSRNASLDDTDLPVVISAASKTSLLAFAQRLASYLRNVQQPPSLKDIAWTLGMKRKWHKFCMVVTAKSSVGLARRLEKREYASFEAPNFSPAVVFVLSGQNKQSVGLSRRIFEQYPRLRWHLDKCDAILLELGYESIYPWIFQTEAVSDPVVLQCSMVASQLSFAQCWIDAGVKLDTVIGHSLGELAGLAISGSLSWRDCFALVAHRAHLMKTKWGPEKGTMLFLSSTREYAQNLCQCVNSAQADSSAVEVACYNGSSGQVLVGTSTSIDGIESLIRSENAFHTPQFSRLDTAYGFHSSLVSPILEDLTRFASRLKWMPAKRRLEVCQEVTSTSQAFYDTAGHARQPVYFQNAVQRVEHRLGSCVWLEIGMGTSIMPLTRRALAKPEQHSLQPVPVIGADGISDAIQNMWRCGISFAHWAVLDEPNIPRKQVWLPPYQFDKNAHWLPHLDRICPNSREVSGSTDGAEKDTSKPIRPPRMVLAQESHEEDTATRHFQVNSGCERFIRILSGHKVRGQSMCLAALYIECAFMGLQIMDPDVLGKRLQCRNIQYYTPLGRKSNVGLTIRPNEERRVWHFTVYTVCKEDESRSTHASGEIMLDTESDFTVIQRYCEGSLSNLLSRGDTEVLLLKRAYRLFDRVVHYDPIFQGIQKITLSSREAVAEVQLSANQPAVEESTVRSSCDAVTLDTFIQVVGLLMNSSDLVSEEEAMIGTGLGEVRFADSCKLDEIRRWTVYAKFSTIDPCQAVGDILVYGIDGQLEGTISGCLFRKVSTSRLEKLLDVSNHSRPTGSQTVTPPTTPECSTRLGSHASSPGGNFRNPDDEAGRALRKITAMYTGVPETEMPKDITLLELGLDSLAAREIVDDLKEELGLVIEPLQLRGMNLRDLSTEQDGLGDPTPAALPAETAKLVDGSDELQPSSGLGALCTEPMHSAYDDICRILCDHSGAPRDTIRESTDLVELGIDSLAISEIKHECELLLGLTLNDNQIAPDMTLNDMMLAMNVEIPQPEKISYTRESRTCCPPVSDLSCRPQNRQHETRIDQTVDPVSVVDERGGSGGFENVSVSGSVVHRSHVESDQNGLLIAYILEAYKTLGLDLRLYSQGEPVPRISHDPSFAKVVERYYQILEEAGFLERSDDGFVRASTTADYPAAKDLHRLFIEAHPSYACEARLMSLTGPRLAQCLQGLVDPKDCLFGSANAWKTMEDFYCNSPLLSTSTKQMVTNIMSLIDRRAQAARKDPFVRILEVGAGTGGTTRELAKALGKKDVPIQYTFTDISPALIRRAKKAFAEYAWMEFQIFDLEKEPANSLLGQFDIVIGTNTVHATTNKSSALRGVRDVLTDTGIAIISEVTRVINWYDLVFGLLEGWWAAEDGVSYPLQPPDVWLSHFRAAGFVDTNCLVGSSEGTATQHIFFARPSESSTTLHLPIICGNMSGVIDDDTWRIETLTYKSIQNLQIDADVYIPKKYHPAPMPMDWNKSSIYWNTTNVIDGAIQDIQDAVIWARTSLPIMLSSRFNIAVDPENLVLIGWSTGGHLAMSASWTLFKSGYDTPKAILVFYSPTIFEQGGLRIPPANNYPTRRMPWPQIFKSTSSSEVTHHDPAGRNEDPAMSWLCRQDPRCELVLSLFREDTGLALLLNTDIPCGESFVCRAGAHAGILGGGSAGDEEDRLVKEVILSQPSRERISAICPLAQLRQGHYVTPTFIIHSDADEVAPYDDAVEFCEAMEDQGVKCDMLKLHGKKHLHDLNIRSHSIEWVEQVEPGYQFLLRALGR